MQNVTVKSMCQFDWSTECPDIWSNITLGVLLRVFLDGFNIYIGRLSTDQITVPNVVGLIQSVEGLNRMKGLTLP